MIKKMGSFRTYVGLEEYELKSPRASDSDGLLQPDFLNGELVISEALNVLKFTSLSKKKGLSGSLFVTNARVIFVSSDNRRIEDAVPLLSINMLWYYENSKSSSTATGTKKHRRVVKLGPSSINNPSIIPSGSIRVHEILIACSNFKTLRFSFKFSPMDNGLRICNSIIHHSFPLQLDRLFYFDYSKATPADNWRNPGSTSRRPNNNINNAINIPTYFERGDWLRELNLLNVSRAGANYRITTANEGFQLCGSLPEWIVVPSDLIDVKLISLAEKLKGTRPPHWSWADSRGGGVLRMSKLNSENDSSAESVFFETLRRTHREKRKPEIIDLDKELPTKEIKQSFSKLFELCCPESFSHYEQTDSRFLSLLEQTKWMSLVSKALEITNYATGLIINHQELIILQEQESRDTACLSSSLIQVVMDARFRTVTGFFSLIQKEWIAYGHPFHSTYMHTSPVLLLFLDCIQQLMKQNLVEFEFNDKLLALVWDASFDSTRGTFLFDGPQQRKIMDRWQDHTDWGAILSNDDEDEQLEAAATCENVKEWGIPVVHHRKLFTSLTGGGSSPPPVLPETLANPMYKLKSLLYPPKLPSHNSSNYPLSTVLGCSSCMCDLHFWINLYLRRTLNVPSPLIVGLGGGDIILKTSSTSNTNTPTSAESIMEGRFLYPQSSSSSNKSKYYAIGRDPSRELKVVEVLLAAVSSSTRYRRHSPGMSSSTNLSQQQQQQSSTGRGGTALLKDRGGVGTTSAMGRQQYQFDAKRTFLK